MPERAQLSPFTPARNASSSRADSYRGAYTDRQRRFDARSERRWGDVFIFDLPALFLWFSSPYDCWPCEEVPFVSPVLAPVIVDLWP